MGINEISGNAVDLRGMEGHLNKFRGISRKQKFSATWLLAAAVLFFSHMPALGAISTQYLSSIAIPGGSPVRLAMDQAGNLYVANTNSGQVLKFNPDRLPGGSIDGFRRPLSVAVDGAGRIYVGDCGDGSVTVYDSAGTYLFSLGSGQGEFAMPGGIAVASNGSVYVTDSPRNVVKVYDSAGVFQFSFGSYGSGSGQMMFPAGIDSDDALEEIYLVDHNNARVQVFSWSGIFKRSFGTYGSGTGKLTRPQGIYAGAGLTYVTDAYQGTVEVFNGNTGSFVAFVGQQGNGQGNLSIPSDIIVQNKRMYVANTDNERIEIYTVLDSNALDINPATLSLTAYPGVNPAGQTVAIDSQVSGTSVAWTASGSSSFPITVTPSGGTAPTTATVSVDATGLTLGGYTGTVNFRSAANNTDYPLTVNLTVSPSQLEVSPASVDMSYFAGGAFPTRTLTVSTNGADSLTWAAGVDVPWLALSATTGIVDPVTPGSIEVALDSAIAGSLAVGSYTGTVTFSSARGNCSVTVNLSVVPTPVYTTPGISIGAPSVSLTRSGPVTYTVSYTNVDSVTLSPANVTLNKTGTANGTVAVSGTGNTTRTITISSITGDGALGISISANTASDGWGNKAPAAGPSQMVNVDNTAPAIVIGAPSATSTRTGPISYTVTYTGADSVTLSSADVTLNKTGTTNGTVAVTGTGTSTRTVTISSITGDGTLGISIQAATASDSAGNTAPAAGPSTTFSVDNTAPTVTISAPSSSSGRSKPITYAITYSGADTVTLAAADITLNKTGTANAGSISVSGTGNTTRTVTLSNFTGDGTLGISIKAGTASDSAGNSAPAAGPSAAFTVGKAKDILPGSWLSPILNLLF